MCIRSCQHTQACGARDPVFSTLPRSQVLGAYHNLEGMPSPPGTVTAAHGQWSGGRGGVSCRSQVAGCFPDDLQGHGGTGELGHGVGQGAGGCPQLPQVGHGVHHAAQEEDEEVHLGDERVRPQEGVNEAQEQEGVDGLHVIPVGSEAAIHILVTPAILEASVSQGVLRVGKSLERISQELLFELQVLALVMNEAAVD